MFLDELPKATTVFSKRFPRVVLAKGHHEVAEERVSAADVVGVIPAFRHALFVGHGALLTLLNDFHQGRAAYSDGRALNAEGRRMPGLPGTYREPGDYLLSLFGGMRALSRWPRSGHGSSLRAPSSPPHRVLSRPRRRALDAGRQARSTLALGSPQARRAVPKATHRTLRRDRHGPAGLVGHRRTSGPRATAQESGPAVHRHGTMLRRYDCHVTARTTRGSRSWTGLQAAISLT